MKFLRRRLVAILVIASIVIFGEIALASAIKKNQELIQPPIKITQAFKEIAYNPDIISEKGSVVPVNPDFQEKEQEELINEFAWRVFIALNWPVDCKGKPLSAIEPQSGQNSPKLIGQAPENPRTWELYHSPQDVFLPKGAEPPPLNNVPEDDRCLNDRAGSEIQYKQSLRLTEAGELVTEAESSEYKIASRKDLLDGNGELKSELDSELDINRKPVKISLKDIDAANKIPLVDRQGNYVINEIRLNPVEFKQIVENKWFDSANMLMFKNSNPEKFFQLVCSSASKSTKGFSNKYCDKYEAEGAIEIKAVWRVFDGRNTDEKEKARYYITKRKIVSKKGEILEEQAELGLIGFHIMHKTSKLSWIWSTFEHIDNAPLCDDRKTTGYTLYNKECNTENCNRPYVKPPYLWYISKDEPKAVTIEVSQGIAVKEQVPSQICRVNQISSQSTTKQNEKWKESLRAVAKSSVWQYYQLIGTQWLSHPEIPYSNKAEGPNISRRGIMPISPPLTNVAMEPYAQGVSCIVCHTSARQSVEGDCQLNGNAKNCADFSFLMDNAKSSAPIPVKPHQ
jgi:hypothetical protein